MSYRKKTNSSYASKHAETKFPKKVHVVVATVGSLEELHVFSDRKKAKAKRDELAKEYGLEGEEYEKSPHGKDCRWSDLNEDEVHMHKVNVE
jgi:hypothetical protein